MRWEKGMTRMKDKERESMALYPWMANQVKFYLI